MFWNDIALQRLVGGTVVLLLVATLAGRLLAWRAGAPSATLQNLNARINAWWGMVAVLVLAVLSGGIGSVVLFAILSFLALREFITLAPTRIADHRALLWTRHGRVLWVGSPRPS